MNYLTKENVEEVLELSLVQKDKLQNGTLTQIFYELPGEYNAQRLQEAWEEVVAAHSILKSLYRPLKNRTVQVVLKQRPIPIQWVNLCGMGVDEQRLEFQSVAQSQCDAIQIDTGPLMRLAVFRFCEESTVILWTHHSLCMDDKSRDNIFNEWMNRVQGKNTLQIHYKSFKEYLAWEVAQDQMPAKKYWNEQLTELEPKSMLQLMHNHKEEKESSLCCRTLISNEVSRLLEQTALKHQVSLEVLSLATWLLLLQVYSRENSVLCGATVNGRPVNWEEEIIGPFEHALPIQISVSPQQQVGEVLDSVQRQWKSLMEIGYVPNGLISTYTDISKDVQLFDSKVTVRHSENQNFADSSLLCRLGQEQVEIIVTIGPQWKIELFHPNAPSLSVLERLLQQFVTILEDISRNSSARVCDLNLVSTEEEQLLLVDFNKSKLPSAPLNRLAHQVIEDQVEKWPESIAAVCGKDSITYRELNEQANQLANWLREQGFGRDDLAVLFAERSIEMLVGILAVLKAGGAYVPLDSMHPDSRLLTVLENSSAKVILTEAKWQSRSLELSQKVPQDVVVFSLDAGDGSCTDIQSIDSYSTENLEFINEPSDLANVFFTSGSTGQPKGAMVEHIGMLNHLYAKINLLGLNENSIVAQNASHCFDISVWQFLAPLMTGGKVVIYSNEVATDPQVLLRVVQKDKISVLEMVPSIIEMFLQTAHDELNHTLPDLQFMISTGEGLPVSLCRRWVEAYPHVKVVNTYGATECSDDTSHEVISGIYPYDNHPQVGLGTPIPNIHYYLLDAWQRPVPIGCIGEVYIAGIGVGRGYLNDPERTDEAFLRNPFIDGAGERMYKTGDLARFTPDGRLVFVSRADFQVKVRGYRIELGEIESVLLRNPVVSQCVAVVQPDTNGNNRLLAYVVLREKVDMLTLKQYLRKHLPEYMVPEHLTILEEMPLNRNGKIDRKALPDPDKFEREGEKFTAPRDEWEIKLVKIWEEVLEISPIGIDDNFFQLGGHSLKTIQIRSRIKQHFDIELVLKDLFDYQTIRELVAVLRETVDGERKPVEEAISQISPMDFYPMSHAQQRLYLLNSLEPDNRSYNMPIAVELNGAFNKEAFEKAVYRLINRHEGLRTTFTIKNGQPVQQISKTPRSECVFFDLSHLGEREQRLKLKEIERTEAETYFNLNSGPLFNVKVYKIDSDRHVLWMNMHHIVGDFWSWQVLIQDFGSLYEAYCHGSTPSLPSLAVQYKDYASWQNERIEKGELVEGERYWLEQFSGELPILELPLDYPRPPLRTFTAAQENYRLNNNILGKLKKLAHEQEATLFMTTLSIVGAFLSRMSGQQDIIISTPEAGRNRMELEGIIGFFVNTLPLRIRLSDNQTFIELLQHCKQVALGAYTQHEYPFDLLVEKVKVDRDLSRSPLSSVMFQLIHPTESFKLGDLNCNSLPVGTDMTNFDLMIICAETEAGLDINFKYRNDLFERETIQRWIKCFTVMIDSILKGANQKVSEITILDEQQQHQYLTEWNNTKKTYPLNTCIHQLFEGKISECSGKIAVEYEDRYLTYHQLDERANQLASYLRKQGVQVGEKVAVCMNRSLDLVIALLGVMKAGGIYIPIDPILPEERIKYMLEDSGVNVILGDSPFLSQMVPEQVLVIDLKMAAIRISKEPKNPLSLSISGTQAAYLIYTSGSTGKPKGVQVSHQSIVNFLMSMIEKPGICVTDRFLSVTTLSFDIFGLELFLPLITGSTVVLASREATIDGFLLAKLIHDRGITIMQGTPATWRLLLAAGWQGCPNLKILCGGELLTRELANELQSRSRELWNMYGPTETTIYSAVHHVTERKGPVKIGPPIMNTEFYVLNSGMQPVPIGVVGELYIGGDGVAQGYWNRLDLNTERFLPNTFTGRGKIYRTGDRVRYLPDGTLEYLGRIDFQVKVRGYRIELSEIEVVLQQHPAVSEAVIVTKNDTLDDKKLIAYLVPSEKTLPNHEELRKHCLIQLPEYMVPSAYVELDEIPLTPNGKVDRKKLEDLNVEIKSHSFTPPRDLNELSLTKIWEDVLNVQSIGIHDHFFDIGGNSLKALLLQNMIRERFAVDLPLSALFQNPTIADLCTQLQGENIEHRSCMIQLQKGEEGNPPLFIIHPHGGGVLPYIHLVKELGPQENIYGIQALGYESDEEPLTSIDEMVDLYLAEICHVVPQGPYRLLGWSFGGTVVYELARKLEYLGGKIDFIGLLDAQPFDSEGVIYSRFTERDAIDYFITMFDFNPNMFTGEALEEDLTTLLQMAKDSGKWAQGMTLESIRRKVRVLVACSKAIENYKYRGPIRSDLHLFCVNEVSKYHHSLVNPNDWVQRTMGEVSKYDVQGDHISMVEPPNVSRLAELIRSELFGIKCELGGG